jgi:hypothetical protein
MCHAVTIVNRTVGTKDAALILGRSVRTVIRQAHDGRLPYLTKVDGERGAFVFNRATIEAIASAEAKHEEALERLRQDDAG